MTATEYILTLQGDPTNLSADDAPDRLTGHRAHAVFARRCAEAGHVIHDDAELHHSRAMVVRIVGGHVSVTDGPFAEGTEVIAGYYRISTPDLDRLALLVADLIRVTGETAVLRESLAAPVGV
ncbi:YciI family protein [Cellulomonas sp. P5_C6]